MYTARGVLVLEEGLKAPEGPFKSRNFRVFIISASPTDQQIADLLTHRILITNNATEFLEPAVIHEFCIIDTEHATKDPEELANNHFEGMARWFAEGAAALPCADQCRWLGDRPRDRGVGPL